MSTFGVIYFTIKYFGNTVNNEWTGIGKVTELTHLMKVRFPEF
jgi:hypothetical protein